MTSATITNAHQPTRRWPSQMRWWGQTRRVCAVALVPIVSACAGSMGTIRPGPSVPSSQAMMVKTVVPATSFDGSYRTTIRVIGSFGGSENIPWCATPGQPIITVANGQFTYAVPHSFATKIATSVFPATMAADGSFYGEIVAGTMSGQVRGTHIEGKIDGSACVYAFSGDRTDNAWPSPPQQSLRTLPQQSTPGSPPPPNLPPRPATHGSSTPPGSNQPGLATLPSPTVPSVDTSPPARNPAGQVYSTQQGPAVTTGGTSHYQTLMTPGGGSAIVVPGGSGTSTIIHSDGRIETVPTPR